MMLMYVVVGVYRICSGVLIRFNFINYWLSRLLWFRMLIYVYMWIRNEVYDGSIISIMVMLCVVGDICEIMQVIG